MPRSISNAASLRLASHQFHSSVFIVNCRLPESFDNVIVVTNGFIIDCRLSMVVLNHFGDWFYNQSVVFAFRALDSSFISLLSIL